MEKKRGIVRWLLLGLIGYQTISLFVKIVLWALLTLSSPEIASKVYSLSMFKVLPQMLSNPSPFYWIIFQIAILQPFLLLLDLVFSVILLVKIYYIKPEAIKWVSIVFSIRFVHVILDRLLSPRIVSGPIPSSFFGKHWSDLLMATFVVAEWIGIILYLKWAEKKFSEQL